MSVIEAIDLSISYGPIMALKKTNLKVEEGTLFALLGKNGAGKTSFMKCSLGLLRPQSGQVSINGLSSENPQSREKVAYLPEKFSFFGFETPFSAVSFFGRMRGLKINIDKEVNLVLEKVGLAELTTRKLKSLSKGQLQRVGIANLLIGDPRILFLDEPFSGLDPIGMKDLKDILVELKNKGATVFINSHILSEMEKICDQFAILEKGECLAQGSLKSTLAGLSLEDYFYKTVGPNKEG